MKDFLIEFYDVNGTLVDSSEMDSSFGACDLARETSSKDEERKIAVITARITLKIYMVYVNGRQISAKI